MFNAPKGKVFLACGYTDGRKSIDGLAAIVQLSFKLDPFSDSYFAFCNKRKTTIKVLKWDGNGFCLYCKRLEAERFKWPMSRKEVLAVTYEELCNLLTGLSLQQKQTRSTNYNAKYAA